MAWVGQAGPVAREWGEGGSQPPFTSCEGLGSRAPLGGHLTSLHDRTGYPPGRVENERKFAPHPRYAQLGRRTREWGAQSRPAAAVAGPGRASGVGWSRRRAARGRPRRGLPRGRLTSW